MKERHDFSASVALDVIKVRQGSVENATQDIATEIPFTITVHEMEIATLLCSPVDLKELAYGFLYTSGFIKSAADVLSFSLDATRWIAAVETASPPDPSHMDKRLYTSGCGKGVMYAHINEIAFRKPIQNTMTVSDETIQALAHWLQHSSDVYRTTGGIHTAALSIRGETPVVHFDDIGRHNAVDKVIGSALIQSIDGTQAILISSGRTSSEILHKARTCAVPIILSRGAPTHQAVLRARDMGITLIGFARGGNFTIYSHEKRIVFK